MIALTAIAIYRAIKARGTPRDKTLSTPQCVLGSILAAGVLVGAGILSARPTESYIVTGDAGTYTIGGIGLARTGRLWLDSSPFWDAWGYVPKPDGSFNPQWADRPTAFRWHFAYLESTGLTSRHYGSFYDRSLSDSSVEPGFLLLPKAWIGLAVLMGGESSAPWASPFVGITSVLGLMLLVKSYRGWLVAALAGAVLAVSLPQIWFSRLATSDIYAQACVLVGLALSAGAHDIRNVRSVSLLAVCSGIALALLSVCRFEASLMVSVVIVALYVCWRAVGHLKQTQKWTLGTALAGLVIGTAISLLTSMIYFTSRLQILLWDRNPTTLVAAVLVASIVMYLLYRARSSPQTVPALFFKRSRARMRYVVVALLLTMVGVALRAVLDDGIAKSAPGWLSLYWGWGCIGLAGLGLCIFAWRGDMPEITALTVLGMISLTALSVSPMVTMSQPWATRRLVPAVFPMLSVMAIYGIDWAMNLLRYRIRPSQAARTLSSTLAILAVAVLLLSVANRAKGIVLHTEHAGEWDELRQLNERFPADAVILFDNGNLANGLTQPLEYVFGHPSAVIRATPGADGRLPFVDSVATRALEAGRSVFVVLTGAGGWRPAELCLSSVGSKLLDLPELQRVYFGGLPNTITRSKTLIDIYELSAVCDQSSRDSGGDVPLATGSYLYLVHGFHYLEYDQEGRPYRWTESEAVVQLPPKPGGATALRVVVSGWRPADVEATTLTVRLDGQIGRQVVLPTDGRKTTVCLDVGPSWLDGTELSLLATPWSPSDYSGGVDQRSLGVALYSVGWVSGGKCVSGD